MQTKTDNYVRSTWEDAVVLAKALRKGPVRAIWTDGITEHGLYFLPQQFVVTRPPKLCGGGS
jgi:hypothetical protein